MSTQPPTCVLCDRPVDTTRTGTVRFNRKLMHDACLSHAAHTAVVVAHAQAT